MEVCGGGGGEEFGADVVEERSVAERVHRVASGSPAATVVYSGNGMDSGCGKRRISDA